MEQFDLDVKVKRIRRNSYYNGIVQNLYSGSESVANLILQYAYDASILSSFMPEIACEFYDFVFDEIKNQYILSQIILMLGGDPIYANAQGRWLGGRSVDYVKDIKQILSLALENKEKIIIDYKSAISKIDDTEIKKYLEMALETEKKHQRKLLELKQNYK